MGLDAVVYVNRKNLPSNVKEDVPNTDDQTGEVYFEDPKFVTKYPKSIFTAVNKNLGNISTIAALRDEVSKIIGEDSIILSKILYSGSHSGDIIGLGEFERLDVRVEPC